VDKYIKEADFSNHQRKKAKTTAQEFWKSLLGNQIPDKEEHAPYSTVVEPDNTELAERVSSLEKRLQTLTAKITHFRNELPNLIEKQVENSLQVTVDGGLLEEEEEEEDLSNYNEELMENFQSNFRETLGLLTGLKQTIPATLNKAIKVNLALGATHKPLSSVDRAIEQVDTQIKGSKAKPKRKRNESSEDGKGTRQQLANSLQPKGNSFPNDGTESGFWS